MSVTHGTATRTALATAVLGEIDAGAGAGNLVFRTSGDVEVATCPLSVTSGVVSGAVLTFNTITDDTNATGGTVAKFTVEDDAAADVLLGNVQTSGGDINLSSLVVGAGDTVSVSSLTYTAAP